MSNSRLEVDKYGTKCWKNKKGQYHRENGPACIYSNETKIWYINDKWHRLDGPAYVYSDGYKSWWLLSKSIRFFSYD